MKLLKSDSRLGSLIILTDVVYTKRQKPIESAWKCIRCGNSVQRAW